MKGYSRQWHRYARRKDPYLEWYWRTWPRHVLPDLEARQKRKAAIKGIVDVVMGTLGLAVVATLVSKNPGNESIKKFGEHFAAVVEKAREERHNEPNHH